MQEIDNTVPSKQGAESAKAPYEAPRIIYEGVISTRAGTPTGGAPEYSDPAISPEDLFGD